MLSCALPRGVGGRGDHSYSCGGHSAPWPEVSVTVITAIMAVTMRAAIEAWQSRCSQGVSGDRKALRSGGHGGHGVGRGLGHGITVVTMAVMAAR